MASKGQLQMVSMPAPQYDYHLGIPWQCQVNTLKVGHLQMPVFSESSAGPVTYSQLSSIQCTSSML